MKSERERFGSIIIFFQKRICSIFWGLLVGKRKQTISKKRWFDITNPNPQVHGTDSRDLDLDPDKNGKDLKDCFNH